tara:strand:+ start:126 stop:644 length:519 start_codon:yes stop_codon:yes gene_type:complete
MIRIQDYIKCYENILDPETCKKIIKEDSQDWNHAAVMDGIIGDDRKCWAKLIDRKFDSILFQCVGKIIERYKKDFKYFITGLTCEDTGYQHLLYKGEEKEHVDHFDLHPRTLSCSLILNDDYDGGDFSFFEGEYVVPKKTGSVVAFPSNFCFPHSITPVTNGDRHAIITWFH